MSLSKFLDPKNDFCFKRIFGTERNSDILNEKDIERIAGRDNAILRAYEELNRFNLNQVELNTYEQEEKRERDAKSILLAKLQDAKAEGGTEKQYLIAKNMLLDHVPIDAVSKYTGLPVEVIRQKDTNPCAPPYHALFGSYSTPPS